ncbi:MAG: hypothetical protein K5900_03280, partial [Butyrivibrio sp.]|nr:hypothetical protein [Butyrivibrio sp.]
GNGDYSQVFTHDVSKLSESGKAEITNYVLLLQGAYGSTGDSRYANELNAVNSFYGDPGNEYAGGYYQDYFLRYYEIAKPYMTIDEKAEVWASPLYKMTDEEVEEARAYASEKLSEFQYGPNHMPLIKTGETEKREKYELYVTLENKCSKVASTFTGVMTQIVSLVDFACDGLLDIIGTAAEIGADSIDQIAGTNTRQSVLNAREGYAQISDELMSDLKRDQANAAVQNKWYFAGGKLAGNALLYMATSPLFGEVAGAMGIKNAAGVFIVNQLGQNAQDLLLDTRVLYNDLVEDGNLSDKDVAELRNNILLNAGFNLAMGGAEETIKAGRNASKADSLMNSFKTVDDQAAFIKSLNADDAALLAKRLGLENADDLMEQAAIAGKSFNSTPDMIKSVGESVDGVKLTGAAAEADDFFKGENFKAADSFNDSIDVTKRATLVNNNAKCTSPLDSNLDGSLKANPGVVDPSDVKDLQNLRQTVSPVTPDTVMQKVIPQGTVDGLMDGGWNTVRGCTSKAVDAAPFTGTPEQAYRNLRLDYNGTPYKDIVDKGEDIYILRYTTDDVPKNVDYPKLDPKYGPPCTETGFLGGNDYLIPEYTHTSQAKITDGAIYKVSPDGTEKMVGYWDASKNGFRNAGEKVEKFNSWDEMKTAHKGTVTKYLKENKPKGSPTPKKWFDKTNYGKSIENTEFFKENGGLDASDYISIHSRKHMYNPDTLSTPKKTQYGKDVNVGKLCKDTIMNPDEVVYNTDQNVMIYKKKYPFNISTS